MFSLELGGDSYGDLITLDFYFGSANNLIYLKKERSQEKNGSAIYFLEASSSGIADQTSPMFPHQIRAMRRPSLGG